MEQDTSDKNSGTTYFDNIIVSDDFASAAAIPEPGTLALVGIALGSLRLFRRRRK